MDESHSKKNSKIITPLKPVKHTKKKFDMVLSKFYSFISFHLLFLLEINEINDSRFLVAH